MNNISSTDFNRIANAILYLKEHFREQPSLEELAGQVHLSAFHFQRLFTEWAGVSPKKFLQYISVEHAKSLLKEKEATLFDAAFETGLSGTGRLHDLFITIEGMTPGEYKNGGENLEISYSLAASPFGEVLLASTARGLCHMAFPEDGERGREQALLRLQEHYPNAAIHEKNEPVHLQALSIFKPDMLSPEPLCLHLKGTPFQLRVWEALLKIPMGRLTTYGKIAAELNSPGASRAVGSAVGSNPVAYLIPCHRVIRASGIIGGYMWGTARKTAMIGWEGVKAQSETQSH